jgi:hypothetical protein
MFIPSRLVRMQLSCQGCDAVHFGVIREINGLTRWPSKEDNYASLASDCQTVCNTNGLGQSVKIGAAWESRDASLGNGTNEEARTFWV